MNNTKRPIYSTISIILVLLMAFLLPVQVFAETTPETKADDSVAFDSLAKVETKANIVTELKDRRDKYTKHFRMDDGTITAVTYDFPVHYKNNKGKWVEYDNSLVATPDEAKVDSYTNKKSDINIELSANGDSSDLVKINTNKGNISWKYTNAKDCDVKIDNTKKQHKGNTEFTSIDKLTSASKYKNIYQNVDLACIVSSTGVKENIILNNAKVKNEFEIEYDIQGLQAKKTDENTIQIQKKGKTIYTISAPLMYDAKGNQSTDLTLNVLSNNNGKLRVKLELDKQFLASSKIVYPVTIDPEVTVSGNVEIETAEVVDSNPNYTPGQQTSFNVGKHINTNTNSTDNYFGLVKIKNLQENYANKNIINAKLTVFPMSAVPGMEIEAHPILNSWSNSTASFSLISDNNNEIINTEVIDYTQTEEASSDGVTFDLTKYAKKWASGSVDNNGVFLTSSDSYGQFGGFQCYYYNSRPSFIVKYKEYTGSESNLTSHTVSCGKNIESSVCDYTGSLTVKQNLYEESGTRIPMCIYATHHSSNKTQQHSLGNGWHMSFDKRLTKSDSCYVYLDADAVEHYFTIENDASELSDDDDLGYTLTIDNENNDLITIDNGSSKETFDDPDTNETTFIKTETDNENSNNQIAYTYNSSNTLTQIQSAQHTYTITSSTVNSNGQTYRIYNSIMKDNNAFVRFVYDSGNKILNEINFEDGKHSTFVYSDNYIQSVKGYSTIGDQYGDGLTFNYNDGKVTQITQHGDNNTSIHTLSVQCNDDNTTVFKADNDINKKETYTFDDYGNTVTILNANGMITNVSNSESTNNTGSDSYTKNYFVDSNEPQGINGSYKIKSGESFDSSGGVVSIDDKTAYLGHKSIKIEHDVSSAKYTFAKQEIYGCDFRENYVTFSAYVKPDGLTADNQSGESGTMLKLVCKKANGNCLVQKNSAIMLSTPNETGWERLSVTTYVPSQTTFIDAYLVLNNAQGSANFDCLQLEEGSVMNDYNALENSDFSSSENWLNEDDSIASCSSGTAQIEGIGREPSVDIDEEEEEGDGSGSELSESESEENESEAESSEETAETYTVSESEAVENDVIEATDEYGNVTKTQQGVVIRTYLRTYESTEPSESETDPTEESISEDTQSSSETNATDDESTSEGTIDPNKFIYQEVEVNKSNVVFNISGTAKADSVPLNNEYRTFGIALKIKYQDEGYTETHYQEFNACTDIYQNVSLSVTPNEDKTIESVEFAFVYGYNKNKMIVKNAMLNYTCYDKAETSEASSSDENTSESTSSEEGSSESSSSEANTSESAASSESEDNRVLIDEELSEENVDENQTFMQSFATYDQTGNYVLSKIDEAGNSESYAYDNSGNVTQITDGMGYTTSYSYDARDNLLSVSSGNFSNTYAYNSRDQLQSITHNNFSYNYSYDTYGNLQSVSAGNSPLASYSYNSSDTLSQLQYGNGDTLNYTYDEYDRVTMVQNGNNQTLAEYTYNKKGLVTTFTDGKSNETTEYVYDCLGNTMSVLVVSESGELLKQLTGDIEKTKINGREYTVENGTDEDDKEYVDYGGTRITTATDDFGRKESVTSSGYTLNYTYKNGSSSHSTTKLIDTMTYSKDGNGIASYSYTYDENGNITYVYNGNTLIARYIYDSHNQLTSVNDGARKLYTVYHYDDNGNITSQTISQLHPQYNYPIGDPQTITYTYGDSNWKDKLTAYNGQSISYDAIGNPTNYRDGMTMSWQNGRELASITKPNGTDTDIYSFKYNLDGLRTEKNIGGTKTYYYYDSNNNLVGMKKGSDTVLYYYDSDGGLVSMSVEGSGSNPDATYLFAKNQQGDITRIVDENGTVCATYSYDAWGKILAETEDSEVEGLNPFRYRGYVYDSETELYYLQSRYYDPLTGRFLNADSPEYTDTQSGSPLSTNMFAYCENNPINKLDYDGYWLKKHHERLTDSADFSDVTKKWSWFPDEICPSDKNYSAPFHGRGRREKNNVEIVVYGALDCFVYMFNKALELKQQSKSNNVAIKFKYAESDSVNCFRKAYMGFVKKNKNGELTNTVSTSCQRAINLISSLNKLKNRRQQSQALLGLALHILQDYYAHLIKVEKCMSNGKVIVGIKNISSLNRVLLPSTAELKQNDEIEDNTNFLSWRYSTAKWATKNFVYDCYTNNRKVNKLSVSYKVKRKMTFYIQWVNKNKKIGYYRKNKGNGYSKYLVFYYEPTLNADVSNGWAYGF